MATLSRLSTALTAYIEAAKRPGVMSTAGWRIVVSFRKELATYFLLLSHSIDLAHVSDEEYGMIEPHLRSIVKRAQPYITQSYLHHAKLAYLTSGKMSVFNEADDSGNFDIARAAGASFNPVQADKIIAKLDKLGLTGKQAVDYISEHGAQLVKGLDEYTIKIVQEIVASGIEDRAGVQGVVKRLREEFKTMSTTRAKSIATTEMNDAMSQAALDKIKEVGLDGKRWIHSPGACPICVQNTAAGIIPVDATFPSGHLRPPAHPGKCRCAVAGARLPIDKGQKT